MEQSPYGDSFTHPIADEHVVFFHGGWGKIAAAASTDYAISRWQPEVLINLGTCGGIEGRAQRGEKLLATRTITYDIHEAIGDSAEAIRAYTTDVDLVGWMARFRSELRRFRWSLPIVTLSRRMFPTWYVALTRSLEIGSQQPSHMWPAVAARLLLSGRLGSRERSTWRRHREPSAVSERGGDNHAVASRHLAKLVPYVLAGLRPSEGLGPL